MAYNKSKAGKYMMTHTITYDKETGEGRESVKMYKTSHFKEEYTILFTRTMHKLYEITSHVEMKVMLELCRIVEYNTGRVYITPLVREEISRMCGGISSQQIANAFTSLKKRKFIVGGRGDFLLNPLIFWKGDNKSRKDLIDLHSLVTFQLDADTPKT